MKVIYLAEPIDQAGSDAHRIASSVHASLEAQDQVAVYRPRFGWTLGQDPRVDSRLEAVNRTALFLADVVLAVLPAGVPSIGVPREIEAAKADGKPVGVLTDLGTAFSLSDVDVFPLDATGAVAAATWAVRQGAPLTRVDPTIHVLPVHPRSQLPMRQHDGDAGFDLFVSRDVTIPPGEFVDVPCGIHVAFPEGVWGRITGRSSTIRKRGLLVAEGVIDTGYRGPLFTGVWNLGSEPQEIKVGERLAQLLLHENVAASFEMRWIDEGDWAALPHDGRGDNGFGSTG